MEDQKPAAPRRGERQPVGEIGQQATPSPRRVGRTGGVGIDWRRTLVAALAAGVAFLMLFSLAGALPGLVYISSIVFLPAGIWVGRGSRRPWLDGAVFGLLATVAVLFILPIQGFTLGSGGFLYPLFLVLPQAITGAWLGARILPQPREGPQPKSEANSDRPGKAPP